MKIELPELQQILQEIKDLRAEVKTLQQGFKVPYMTRSEFCKEFSISISSCRNYERDEILTPKKLGSKTLYNITEINSFLDSQ